MAFWNKKTQQSKPQQEPAYAAPIPLWDHAKKITKDQWAEGSLPIGWYVYDEGYGYQAIRPHPDGTKSETAWFHMYNMDQISPWLGVPLPNEMLEKSEAAPSIESDGQSTHSTPEQESFPPEQISSSVPIGSESDSNSLIYESPTSAEVLEQQWAAARMKEGLEKNRTPKNAKRKRPNMVRFMLSDEEHALFLNRVDRSGMTQTEFLRQASLNNQVIVKPKNPELIQAIHDLTSELGRQGGLIAMWLKPNEGQRTLHPEEWDYLVQQVHYIDDIKPKLKQLMEDISNS